MRAAALVRQDDSTGAGRVPAGVAVGSGSRARTRRWFLRSHSALHHDRDLRSCRGVRCFDADCRRGAILANIRFGRRTAPGLARASRRNDAPVSRPAGTRDSNARHWFHHFTFYGFLLCFASTTSAAIDHYLLALDAPYPFLSVPVIFGTLGGIGLLIGPAGLYFVKLRRDPAISDPQQNSADVSFLALLFLTSLTGLLLLALRDAREMAILLRVHLGVVLALFLTMPYGKFVHGAYRLAALVRYAFEAASPAARKAR